MAAMRASVSSRCAAFAPRRYETGKASAGASHPNRNAATVNPSATEYTPAYAYVEPRIARASTTRRANVTPRTKARRSHGPGGARAKTITPSVIASDAMADAGKYQVPLAGGTITGLVGGSSWNRRSGDVASRSIEPIAMIATNPWRNRR